MYTSLRVR